MRKKFTIKKLLIKGLAYTALGFVSIMSQSLQAQNPFDPWCNWIDNTNNGNLTTYMSAIEEILITEGNNVVYNKAPDGYQWGGANPSSSGQVLNNATNPLTLNAGTTYRLGVSFSCRMNSYTSSGWNAWIDYNNNKTFDANESLATTFTPGPHVMNAGPGTMVYITFTLPCNVTEDVTRLRIKCSYAGQVVNASVGCATTAAFLYGEAEDLHIKILKPTSIAANFIVPDDVWVNSPVVFNNANKTGYIRHDWDRDLNGYDFTGVNYTTVFNTPGTNFVKLRSQNCLGFDSVVKSINVKIPNVRPVSDFIANRTVIEDGDEITLYDLSTFGPTSWDWTLEDMNNPFTMQDNSYIIGGSQFGGSYYRAIFEMFDLGKFDVTLESSNAQGTGSKTKAEYITVNPFSEFWLGAGANSTQIGKGTIFDKGGPNSNYATGNNGDPTVNRLRIQPCGAEEIILNISQFKFGSASHNFKVWDGPNATSGVPLHPSGGFTRENTKAPLTIVARSGSMYMELDTRAAGAVDSGLIATFTTKYGAVGPPQPSFKISGQDTAYTRAPIAIRSNSSNIYGLASFVWTVNGNATFPSQVSDEGKLLTYSFPTAGKYNVCLDITSCTGDATYCDTITVINPTSASKVDFVADIRRPNTNELTTITSLTDKADRFRWIITPFNYILEPGVTLNSKDLKLRFTQTGEYNVSLRAWSSLDSIATTKPMVKDKYLVVVNPCVPAAGILSADVSNASVIVKNWNNQTIFTRNTTTGVTDYETFMSPNDEAINLTIGATYNVEIARATNADPASRAVYIDFNINGFFEPFERVLHEVNSSNLMSNASFSVPDINTSIIGETRMRVVTTYANASTEPCGPTTSGEYEDHKVFISGTTFKPVITLNGNSTIEIEQGSTYSDSGAIAMDVVEGNISSKMVVTNDLNRMMPGQYFYKYEVANATGLQADAAIRTIIVTIDKTAPVLNLLGSQLDTFEVNSGVYSDAGAIAIDLVDGNLTSAIKVVSNVNPNLIGNYTIVYTVSDKLGNTSTITRHVAVVDRTAPVINFVGTEQVQIGQFWFDQTYATDNYWFGSNLTLTKSYGFAGPPRWDTKGVYPVTYTAVDGSGNTSVVNRTYVVSDYIAPIIDLHTEDSVYHNVRTPYISVNPSVSDDYDSADDISFVKSSNVNPDVLGKYEEKFRATDASGNITERIRWVIVRDIVAPRISAGPICSKLGIDFNPLHGLVIEDNYYSQAQLLPLVEIRESNVNPFSVGRYTASYQVMDPSGNRSTIVWREIEISEACELVTSIEDIESAKVGVYPNPSTGKFTVKMISRNDNIESIEVLNAVGAVIKVISNVSNNETLIDLTDETSGIYLIRTKSNSGVNVNRVNITK
jgi:hypothetical protein